MSRLSDYRVGSEEVVLPELPSDQQVVEPPELTVRHRSGARMTCGDTVMQRWLARMRHLGEEERG